MAHIRSPIKFLIQQNAKPQRAFDFSVPTCVPSTNNVFLFAYSNDLDSNTVAAVRDGVVHDWAWQHDPIVGNVRFDVKQEEEIQFHRDVVSFNSSVSSRMPNPSLGYGDNTTDSDVFNVIQKFLNNSEAPVCGAVLYIIVKRYPGSDQTNPLLSQLQNNHVYVYYHVHSDPSGGLRRHVMFDMAAVTNGFCIFGDDDGKTKEFTTSARNGVGLINRPYQYISKRYVVQAGSGRIELPVFRSPNPNASKEQVLAVTTVEETPLDGTYLSLNYTVRSVDGTLLTTFPGGYWTQLGSGIINYFDMDGKVDYNWIIDYHYSAGRQQVIEHRVYGFYYHDFLPFAKIVP